MLNPIITKDLSYEDYNRYARQLIIKEINIIGQKRLKKAKVICIGLGGLNSPASLYLAACGIGTLGIIDNDKIETSNLQRQIIYTNNNIKKAKAKAAFNTLKCLNPLITINSYNYHLSKKNIKEILLHYDIIIDGTDNFSTRYLISQYCYSLHKIHIYGSIEKFIGQISIFNYQNGPHYYNLYNKISNIKINNCNESGIINTLAGIIGTLQATEAIKIITGIGSILNGHLTVFNILQCSLDKIKIKQSKIKEQVILKPYKKNVKQYISINYLKENDQQSYQLIDVRTSLEFRLNYIDKAINIPLNILKKEESIKRIKKITDSTIIIYCNDENRSYIASQILHRHHINHFILYGGINTIRKERDSNPR